MKKVKRLATLFLAFAMAASLAACGSSGSSSGSGAVSGSSDSGSSGVKVVRIGISTDSMPNCYVDADGNLAGENYEVMCLVDQMLDDYEFQYEPVTQDVILTGLDTGTYSVGIFNAFYNDDRAAKYLFPTYPVSGGVRGLILPSKDQNQFKAGTADEVLDQFAALGLNMVPVSPGDSSDTMYSKYNESHDPKINYQVTEEIDVSTSIKYIMEGRYDGAMFLESNYATVNSDVDPDGNTYFLPFDDGGFGTWVLYAKGEDDLVAAVDKCMEQLYADGTMAAISMKYYGENVFQYIDGFKYADVTPNANYK
jgi:L-cystine transport system substrate-binding protein